MIPIPPKLMLYGGIALAVLIGVGVVYQKGKSAGAEQQKSEMVADAKVQMEEVRKAAEAEFQRITTASEAAIQEARASRQASERRESVLVSTLAGLSQQRQAASQQVSKLTDSNLHGAIVENLGIRSPQDTSPNYLPLEERKILETLTDYPLLKQQNQAIQAQVTEIRDQVSSLRQELGAVSAQAQAEKTLRLSYAQVYQQAYNLLRQKKRSARCFYIWRCGKEPLLSIPSPEKLAPATP